MNEWKGNKEIQINGPTNVKQSRTKNWIDAYADADAYAVVDR